MGLSKNLCPGARKQAPGLKFLLRLKAVKEGLGRQCASLLHAPKPNYFDYTLGVRPYLPGRLGFRPRLRRNRRKGWEGSAMLHAYGRIAVA